MHRLWSVLASAVLAVALEIAVNLIAGSVTVPRRYYFAPIGAFVVLVGLQFISALRDQHSPARRGEHPVVRLSKGRHTIKGCWHQPSLNTILSVVILAGFCLFLGSFTLLGKASAGLLIIILFFVVLLAALCIWVALGSRVSLEFSADGMAVQRSLGRKRRLRWDEAMNFRTDRDKFVAEPAEVSTWYLHGWDFDDSDGVIRICDLWRAGIAPAAVEAAIRYWNSARRRTPRSEGPG